MAGAGYKLFNTGDVLTAAQVNTYLNEQTVMVFASSAARTSALSGVLAEGMMSYLQDTNAVEVYNGTSWVNVGNAGDITEVQAGVGISIASGTGPIPVITNSSTDLITSAGDLLYGTAADTMARLGIGTAGRVLKVNSGATAPEWAVDPTTDVVTTAGDLIYATGADAVTRLGIGTAGQVLKVNSGATAPEWGAAGGAASFVGVKCVGAGSSTQSINNSTLTAVTFSDESFDTDAFHSTSSNTSRITIPSGKGGKYAINGTIGWTANGSGERILKLYLNGASKEVTAATTTSAGTTTTQINTVYDLVATDYIELYVFQNSGGTRTIQFDDAGEDLCWFSATYLGA